MENPIGDRLLPSLQMDTRGFYAADANNMHFMELNSAGDIGARIIPDGHGLPMAVGLGQQIFGSWCTIMACIASSFSSRPNLCY